MNIFKRELKANLRSLLIWGGIVILFTWLGASKFSAYYGSPDMLAVLDSMPPALVAAFSLKAFNLTTLSGFFGLMFTYYALLLGIAAAMWGSDIISKEERDKTVEFSLTLPVSRARLVTAKALAALANCIALLLITWGAAVVNAAFYPPEAGLHGFLALCMLALFLLQLVFLAVGLFLGCAMRRYRLASAVAVGLLLGTYFLSIVAVLSRDLDWLKYLTPFKYFDASALLHESRLDPLFVGLALAIVVLSMAGAYLVYGRRDLYI